MAKRVVLAYSGGLDTSVLVRWMQEEMGVEEVFCLCADVGQETTGDWDAVRERAFAAGAADIEVRDLRKEFADEILAPALKANAKYEGKYPLVSALSRPIIAKHLVLAARQWGADAVAHGCTGKGNDQVRFEVSARTLAPDLEVLAPVRHWGFTREDSILYAYRHNIPITATKEKLYSIDDNLWGRAIECGEMEDPWAAPPPGVWAMTVQTATEPREVVIAFEQGKPVALDGAAMPLHELVHQMNGIVGAYGWGRLDMVENRRVGIKSRETYECPAALALLLAHSDLEDITLERDVHHEKARLEPRYAELVYDGLWYSPLKRAFDAFVDETQRFVTGEVRLRLEPGRCFVNGRRSPHSLYDYGLATYDAADTFRHSDSEGFVRIWGLGVQTWAQRQSGWPRVGRDALARPLRVRPGRRAARVHRVADVRSASRGRRHRRLARTRARVWCGPGLLDGDEAAAILSALDAVADELADGHLRLRCPPTRTSTPRSSGGSPSSPGPSAASCTQGAAATTRSRLLCGCGASASCACRRSAGRSCCSRSCSIGASRRRRRVPAGVHARAARPTRAPRASPARPRLGARS